MTDGTDDALKREIQALVETYVALLDERRDREWLELFAEDGYYAVLRYTEFAKDNNTLILGEDIGRLRARIDMGLELDKRRRLHMLTATRVRAGEPKIAAVCNFALWLDGVATYAGQYHLDLARAPGGLRISRCQVVIDNAMITDAVYLPI